ncbi:DUF3744 domain-containing protein [Clostridium sp. C8-1-8]|uniref:ABC transporter ATP-binding protein n=1 Tax=Clostridium sp. C8-1-8 TaxID=2698831 RepID=UPI001FACCEF0|nr:DUF3744 domain-containing protein [Clostridium sp. C8-1-8]
MSAIEFKEFSFKYSSVKDYTLKNINLKINAGEKVLIAGPSGSGKSTLAHCINGLIPFMYKGEIKGIIKIDDLEPHKSSLHEVSKHVGTILQDQDGQFVGISVGEDVAFFYENHNVSKDIMKDGVEKALEAVGMLDYIEESPQNLSGGQKQKVSMAGILTSNCNTLLFDEPLANLDPFSSKKAMEKIVEINEKTNSTIIVIEHRVEEVLEHNFDRVILISDGEIKYDGTPDEILSLNLLSAYGIREPLYIEAIKKCNLSISKDDNIVNINNCIKYKEAILDEFNNKDVHIREKASCKLLDVEKLSFKYFKEKEDILSNISFSIEKGEMLAILGNNGAGKSTLMKILTGIERQSSGTIKYLGKSIDKWSIKKRSEIIGYVMQNPNQMITQNMIFDEVALGLRNKGFEEVFIKSRVEETLKVCGLYKYRKWPVGALSYGQKKRVTIAAILVTKPDILILDEPTAGQDYRNYKEFMGFIEHIKATGVTIIMITHDLNLTLEYADRVIVLSEGKLIGCGSIFSIMNNKEIIKRASLKEPSLYKMAEVLGVKERDKFTSYFIDKIKEDCTYE